MWVEVVWSFFTTVSLEKRALLLLVASRRELLDVETAKLNLVGYLDTEQPLFISIRTECFSYIPAMTEKQGQESNHYGKSSSQYSHQKIGVVRDEIHRTYVSQIIYQVK